MIRSLERLRSMKALRVIAALAAAHFVIGFGLFIYSFGRGMRRFDRGEMPGVFDRIVNITVDVLWFPILYLWQATKIGGDGLAGWLLFFANSLLWGLFLYAVIFGCRRLWHLRRRERGAA